MTALISVEEAAASLGLAKGTLDKWRVQGRGPKFLKLGSAVKYRAEDIEAFLADAARSSTSQEAA